MPRLQQVLSAPSVPSNPSFALRINAGGGSYVDSAGNTWLADTDYTGGSTNSTSGRSGNVESGVVPVGAIRDDGLRHPGAGPGYLHHPSVTESEIYLRTSGRGSGYSASRPTALPVSPKHRLLGAVGANAAEVLTASRCPSTGST